MRHHKRFTQSESVGKPLGIAVGNRTIIRVAHGQLCRNRATIMTNDNPLPKNCYEQTAAETQCQIIRIWMQQHIGKRKGMSNYQMVNVLSTSPKCSLRSLQVITRKPNVVNTSCHYGHWTRNLSSKGEVSHQLNYGALSWDMTRLSLSEWK